MGRGFKGAAAHLAKKGHIIIIASYVSMEEAEAINHQPILVYVDEKNKIKAIKNDYSAVIGMGR